VKRALKPILTKASLTKFYETHEPTKVAAVDSLLANFDTEELLGALEQKYGAQPELASTETVARPILTKASLTKFYETHEPAKVAAVDSLLANFDTEELLGALEQKYGERPDVEHPSSRE
jgi:hypothetical protein